MPLKPIKGGYKVWIRAGESGYVHQFQIYVGKVGNDVEKNLGARVVKDLTRNITGKDYNLHFDNFFNSVGKIYKMMSCTLVKLFEKEEKTCQRT
jgi:hypothetical protein